jgi:hypothetical protein
LTNCTSRDGYLRIRLEVISGLRLYLLGVLIGSVGLWCSCALDVPWPHVWQSCEGAIPRQPTALQTATEQVPPSPVACGNACSLDPQLRSIPRISHAPKVGLREACAPPHGTTRMRHSRQVEAQPSSIAWRYTSQDDQRDEVALLRLAELVSGPSGTLLVRRF